MANPTTTVPDYCGVLTRSRLMLANEVRTVVDRWRTETKATDAEVDSFRKYLVSRKLLTEYQAVMVQRGHADGFYIGGYVVLDRIGKGQMAGVYKAVHTSGQIVALKVLSASKARNNHFLGRFQREARLLTQLNHPNVVRAFQLGSTKDDNGAPGVHYIVMEHLEGETLDEVIGRRKKLPPSEAARLLHQCLQGLQHLHDRRMVHRDLKPANLMLVTTALSRLDTTLSSTVKILDIGLGRELFDEDLSGTHDMHLTAEGSLVGTPDYLAPEQARDARSSDIRADVYGLGCVLFACLAGRPPFVEKNVMATMVKHATEPPPAIAQFVPDVSPGLQAVLNKMLAKDPAGRYQTPGDAANALRPYLPLDSAAAVSTTVLPGFQEFLNSDAGELGEFLPSGITDAKALAGIRPDPPAPAPLPRKPPDPPRPAAVVPPPPPPPPVKPRASVSGPPSGKIRVGTGLAAALSGASTPKVSGTIPASLKPAASTPPRPSPVAASDEFDVELVTTTQPLADAADVLQARMADTPMRPLYDLDRRDFIMMAIGAGGVLTAIAMGLGVAKFSGHKMRGGEEESNPNSP